MNILACQYCGATEQSKTAFAHHVCDKDILRNRIVAQDALLHRLYDEASAITASGFPANTDAETTGWRIDCPLYLSLEEYLHPKGTWPDVSDMPDQCRQMGY